MSVSLVLVTALAQQADYPSSTFTPGELWQIVSPDMGVETQLQPEAVNGHLVLAGNARHEVWNIEDPYAPLHVSTFTSPHADGEAEAHDNSQQRRGEQMLLATISGRGVDLWDLTEPATPVALAHVELDGIEYGDNSEAVWGLSWQGDALYVGGTNTGIHVLDTSDPSSPSVVTRIPTSAYGGSSAGPLWAVGNVLVVTPPKDRSGLATLDISDPFDPVPLGALQTPDDSYIGGFYGSYAYLVNPWRTYDVLGDPTRIVELGNQPSPPTEYMSFANGYAFVGAMRPNPGILKWDISDPIQRVEIGKVEGRTDGVDGGFLTDDQFGLAVGNLLVMCDDELRHGCVLAVHDTAPDSTPLRLLTSVPADGAVGLPVTSRIGLSFDDQVDLRSADPEAVVLRPLGGDPVPLEVGLDQTVLHLWPESPLLEDTSYEVVLPTGGLSDLSGNGLASEVRLVFTTGDGAVPPPCSIEPLPPVQTGVAATLAAGPVPDATFRWQLPGEERVGASVQVSFAEPGRHPVGLTVERDGLERSCTAVQIVHPPLTEQAPLHASTIAVDPTGTVAWVVNPDAGSVATVDLQTMARTGEFPVGARPRTVALDERGHAWVTVQDEDLLVELDPSGAVVQKVTLPWGSRPYGVVATSRTVWVTLEGRGALVGVDRTSGALVQRFVLGGDPDLPGPPVRGLAIDADRSTAWVTRFLSAGEQGEVYAVDLQDGSFETVALVHDDTPDDHDAGRGVPNALSSVTLTPDGSRALVPGKKDNVRRGSQRDGELLDPDNTVRTLVAFVDTASRTEVREARVDIDDHEQPFAGVFSPIGDLAFVVSQGTNRVDVIETWSSRTIGGINTGLAPNGLAITDSGLLVVQELNSRQVSVFDVSGFLDGTDTTAFPVGKVGTVAEEPLSETVWLGKVLFMNANNSATSQDGYLACSTCHPDGGHDGQRWDFTQHGEGIRNTIDLRGKAGTGHGPLHWTANFDEVQDFEIDIRTHQGGSGLLAAEDWELASDPLGTVKAGRSERLDALAAYVTSLASFPRSPYRNDDGTLTEAAERGRRRFERLDCLECHSGPDLTDSATGVRHDVGTLSEASGARLGGTLDGIDTPTLFGLHTTAPYLHDGSAADLYQVLAIEGHGNAQKLKPEQLDELVAFLLQLEPDVEVAQRRCGCAHQGLTWPGWLGLVGLLLRRRVDGA